MTKLLNCITLRLRQINTILVCALLSFIIPQYGKRMIFVVSLYIALGGNSAKRSEFLSKLNRVMHLARDERALDFSANIAIKVLNPDDISRLIASLAHGRQIKDGLNGREVHLIACELSKRMPEWLRYDKNENIVSDAERTMMSAVSLPSGA